MNFYKIKALIILILLGFTISSGAQDGGLGKPVNAVIDNYLNLKNTLAAGDGDGAMLKAKALLAAINDVPEKSMDKKQLSLWKKYAPKLQMDSRHISEVNRLMHQREHFANISNNLYAVLKELKLNKTVLYREYCDMKQQYYISDNPAGRDPYMGMSNCSKVKETLPAIK